MVELKSKNLFYLGDANGVYVASKVIDFLDLIGKNIIFLYDEKTTLSSIMRIKKVKFTKSNLIEELKNNLFRVDIIVIETNDMKSYNDIRKFTNLPLIYITNKMYIHSDFDCAYRLYKEKWVVSGTNIPSSIQISNLDKLEEYLVEDLKNGWNSNLKNLKVQYIRDKNLRDLLGDDE